jgi:D-lactate dehydrogenase (cytochrome)
VTANFESVRAALADRFGDRFSTNDSVREQHCQSLTWLPSQPPQGVVYVENRDEVVEVVRSCAAHRTPIIPFGAGSSLEGQLNAPHGGVSVDLSRMKTILSVDSDNMTATVQPGVTREQLNVHLRDQGLFFSVDPGADASMGGMASTRASGTNTVRYGTIRENILALEVVLPDGQVTRAGSRAKKSAAGYDLARLFIGAEGTLGIITELTVRLHPVPEQIGSGVCPFPSAEAATRAVIVAIQLGIDLARIELVDELAIQACNRYADLRLEEKVHLFIELHGDDAHVQGQADRLAEVIAEHSGGPFHWTTVATDRAKLWQARHDAWWAIHALFPGRRGIPTDTCVPLSQLATCVTETQRDVRASGLDAPLIGHVGDGNFHLLIMVDMQDRDMVERARALATRLNERAIVMGGTSTGEHGVGQGKAGVMRVEHGHGVEVMRAIKQALDPVDIMNPGKIWPDHDEHDVVE